NVAAIKRTIESEVAKVTLDEEDEEDADAKPAEVKRAEYVWIDDDLPPNAKPSADGSRNGQWQWVTEGEGPVFSGKRSSKRTAEGVSQHFFENAQPGLSVGAGDILFAYVYLDPANPPKEVMLQWNTGEWKHRAYWGENVIDFGQD